jgi:hypothetical protein
MGTEREGIPDRVSWAQQPHTLALYLVLLQQFLCLSSVKRLHNPTKGYFYGSHFIEKDTGTLGVSIMCLNPLSSRDGAKSQ